MTYGSANIYFRLREMKQRNSITFIYKYVHCERHDFYKFREWFTCTSVWLFVLLARSGSESRATKMYWHKLIKKNEIASIRYESTECVYLELINGSFLKGLMLDFFSWMYVFRAISLWLRFWKGERKKWLQTVRISRPNQFNRQIKCVLCTHLRCMIRDVMAREKKWKEQSVGGSDDADADAATCSVCATHSRRKKLRNLI